LFLIVVLPRKPGALTDVAHLEVPLTISQHHVGLLLNESIVMRRSIENLQMTPCILCTYHRLHEWQEILKS